jgi:hypothetical protein
MILINEYDNTAVRCEGDGEAELLAALTDLVRKGTEVIGGEDGEALTEETVGPAVAWAKAEGFLDEAFDAVFLTEEEGGEGVACCFSSADRSCFAVPWPPGPDEWLGNGDAVVYRTAGVPAGVPVEGVSEVDLGED